MSNFLVGAVSKTVTNLYVLTSIDHFYLPFWQIPLVLLAGMGSVLVGAFIPANAGANLPPLRALNMGVLIERSERPGLHWIVLSGGSLLAAFGASELALSGYRSAGFAAAFFTLIGFCCLSPYVTHQFGTWTGQIFRASAFPAARRSESGPITLSARHYDSGARIGIGDAGQRFDYDLFVPQNGRSMAGRRLVADLFVAPSANEIVGFENFVSEDFIKFLRSRPEVEMIDTFRNLTVTVNGEPAFLGVITGTNRNIPEFIGGENTEKYQAFQLADRVTISEPLSRRLKLNQGDTVTIATPLGPHSFQVAGVFYDYSRDSGVMLMQRANFEKFWHDSRVNSVSLYLRPGTDVEKMIQTIRTGYPEAGDYSVYSNRALRDAVVAVFNQTFAVTQILRLIAVLVAVIGIALNLTVLVKEREREIGTLRAVGVSRPQIRGLIVWESLLVGMMAVLLGVVTGVALSVVLTEVINKAFFGWTIPLQIPWDQLLWTPVWLLPAAIVASLLPANQASRRNIIDAVRMEA